jgi:hypothetical protein
MRRRIFGLAVVSALAAQYLTAVPASAVDCYSGPRCFGRAVWSVNSPSGFEGARADLRTNCMDTIYFTREILANSLWVSDQTVSPTQGANYWTEVGITVGIHNDGGNNVQPLYYWADQRPAGGGYHDHFFQGPIPLGTYITASIWETSNGSGSWNVQIGVGTGTSTSNFTGPSRRLATGTESTSATGGHTFGSSSSMSYLSNTRSWVSGWNSALSGPAGLEGVLYRQWGQQFTWLQDGTAAAC